VSFGRAEVERRSPEIPDTEKFAIARPWSFGSKNKGIISAYGRRRTLICSLGRSVLTASCTDSRRANRHQTGLTACKLTKALAPWGFTSARHLDRNQHAADPWDDAIEPATEITLSASDTPEWSGKTGATLSGFPPWRREIIEPVSCAASGRGRPRTETTPAVLFGRSSFPAGSWSPRRRARRRSRGLRAFPAPVVCCPRAAQPACLPA
jgi:hypothetical protein